jgi:hypothetical protein
VDGFKEGSTKWLASVRHRPVTSSAKPVAVAGPEPMGRVYRPITDADITFFFVQIVEIAFTSQTLLAHCLSIRGLTSISTRSTIVVTLPPCHFFSFEALLRAVTCCYGISRICIMIAHHQALWGNADVIADPC